MVPGFAADGNAFDYGAALPGEGCLICGICVPRCFLKPGRFWKVRGNREQPCCRSIDTMKTTAALCLSWGRLAAGQGFAPSRGSLRLNEGPAEQQPWEPCPHQALNSMKAQPVTLSPQCPLHVRR